MKLFIDTGSVAEVEEIAGWGVLSGATTNPSLLAKEDGDPGEIVVRICEIVDGPVSAEVVSPDAEGMLAEGRALAGSAPPCGGQGPLQRGRAVGHARPHRRGHPGEHDAGVLRRPGRAGRRGGGHLRVVLHGPGGRHLGRLHRGAGRDRRDPGRQRGAGARRLAAPSDARRHRRSAGLRGARRCPARCCARCSSTRSPPAGSSASRPTGAPARSSPTGSASRAASALGAVARVTAPLSPP